MKVENGKRYVRRDGKITNPLEHCGPIGFLFDSAHSCVYSAHDDDGHKIYESFDDDGDLIQEFQQ